MAEVEERFAGDEDVPLPPFWGGYRVVPDAFELWQSRATGSTTARATSATAPLATHRLAP